jgi:Tat protein translocase TatB subunit
MFINSELIVTLVIALLVLGPKRLPAAANWCGKLWRVIANSIDKLQIQIEQAQREAELQKNILRARRIEQLLPDDENHQR